MNITVINKKSKTEKLKKNLIEIVWRLGLDRIREIERQRENPVKSV